MDPSPLQPQQGMSEMRWLLRRVFSDPAAASWLLSKDPLPPTLYGSMMKHSLTGEMISSNNLQDVCQMFRSYERQTTTSLSSGSRSTSLDSGAIVATTVSTTHTKVEPEKLVFMCHGMARNKAFLTVTDTRNPLAFLEAPSPSVPGVRRVFCEYTDTDYLMSSYYHLQNGNSMMVVLIYPLGKEWAPRKFMMLFKQYPQNRYPQESDILESVIMTELPDCQFCLLRGLDNCECSPLALQRMKPLIPNIPKTDPFKMWAWLFAEGDSALRRNRVTFTNYRLNVSVSAEVFLFMNPTFSKASSLQHVQGFKYYLDSVDQALTADALRRSAQDMLRVPRTEELSSGSAGAKPGQTKLVIPSLAQGLYMEPLQHQQRGIAQALSGAATIMDIQDDISAPLVSGSQSNPPDHGHDEKSMEEGEEADPQPSAEEIKAAEEYMNEVNVMKWVPNSQNPCKLCGAFFIRKFDLKRHLKASHLMNRDFVCSECGKGFKRKQHLDSHIAQVHQKARCVCSVCDKVLTSDSNLRRHMRNVHHFQGEAQNRGVP